MTIRDALLRARRRPRHLGAGSPTIYRGDGYEFVELRAYVPGDDVRRIDWAATARSGDLQTRVVLEDVALTLAAIVDASPSMRVGRHRPLLDAAREAAGERGSARRSARIAASASTPTASRRRRCSAGARRALSRVRTGERRSTRGASLRTARAALAARNGAAGDRRLVRSRRRISTAILADLGARFDCTALVARDPWYDGLPLGGMVRLRGAEGGTLRAYVGARERAAYPRAVRDAKPRCWRALPRRTGAPAFSARRTAPRRWPAAFGLRAREHRSSGAARRRRSSAS